MMGCKGEMNEVLITRFARLKHFAFPEEPWSTYAGFEIQASCGINLVKEKLNGVADLAQLVAEFQSESAIRVLISDTQSCCENWGIFLEQDLHRFRLKDTDEADVMKSLVGQRLVDVYWGPEQRVKKDEEDGYKNSASVVIRHNKSNAGPDSLLWIHLYNNHNGYYSHDIVLQKHHHIDKQSL